MRVSLFLGYRFLLALGFIASITACGGGGTSSSQVTTSLTLAPTSLSMNTGDVQALTVTAKNSKGTQIFPTITYSTSDATVANASSAGNICAGTWDSSFIVCTPGKSGTATITATASGAT